MRQERELKMKVMFYRELLAQAEKMQATAWCVFKEYNRTLEGWDPALYAAHFTKAEATTHAAVLQAEHKVDFAAHPHWGSYAQRHDTFLVKRAKVSVSMLHHTLGQLESK